MCLSPIFNIYYIFPLSQAILHQGVGQFQNLFWMKCGIVIIIQIEIAIEIDADPDLASPTRSFVDRCPSHKKELLRKA